MRFIRALTHTFSLFISNTISPLPSFTLQQTRAAYLLAHSLAVNRPFFL